MELTENPTYTENPGILKSASVFDWIFALILASGALFAFNRYGDFMDIYEKVILLAAAPVFVGLGWYWKSSRVLMLLIFGLSLWAI